MKRIRTKLAVILLSSGITSVVWTLAPAATADPVRRSAMMTDEVWDDMQAEEPEIIRRRERIEIEISALDRESLDDSNWAKEWAGKYYTGDGLGENVTILIAPETGISFLNYGCMGLYGADHGDIAEVLPDGLKLNLAFGDARNSFLSERVYFLRWDDERYLIPDWQMMEFVNNYNRGGWQRYSMYGIPRHVPDGENIRQFRSDTEHPVGKPQVPDQFTEMLFDHPVALKVTHVSNVDVNREDDGWKRQTCIATFDRGTDVGIYAGMEFTFQRQDPPRVYGSFRITFADTGISTGEFTVRSRNGNAANLPARSEIVLAGCGDSPTTENSLPTGGDD